LKENETERVSISDDKKALLQQVFEIDVDSDLFDPRLDYVAKRIFTAETAESKKALIAFLNAALQIYEKNKIVDLSVISPVIPVDNIKNKKPVFDIRVRFANGEQAIVEMEFHKKDDFKRRSQFIISRAYSSQDISGKTFADLKKCYLICIMNYPLFKTDNKYYRDIMFRDENGVPLTDDEVIIFLELSKIESLLEKPVEKLTDIEKWMIFFRYATDKSKREMLNKILEKEEGIGMAVQILERMSLSEEERAGYEALLIAGLDERSAQRARENRLKEIEEIAIKEIKESAIKEVARGFKNDNVPLHSISKNTGLSLEEIEAL